MSMKKLTDVFNIDELLLDEIYHRANKGKPLIEHLGATKSFPDFEDLKFLPNQLHEFMLTEDVEVSTKTIIGPNAKKPLEIDTPMMFTATTFGVLSGAAKIAFAKASSLAGTSANSGEGGFQKKERELANKYVVQYNRGGFSNSEEELKSADMIEIKWAQGANPGTQDMKQSNKLTEELRKIRGLAPGEDSYMPAHHRNINNKEDLKEVVSWLKELTDGVPIAIKFAASRIKEDIDVALEAGVDVIVIDGAQGGTGGSLLLTENEFGIPSMYAAAMASDYLKEKGVKDKISLILAGGIRTPGDMMKALSLGVDAIYACTLFLLAMTLPQARDKVFINDPLMLVHYNVPENSLFNIDQGAQSLANYINAATEEIEKGCRLLGINDIHKLNKNHMYSLNEQTSKVTGVKYITEL